MKILTTYRYLLFLIIIFGVTACEDEFRPELNKYDDLLVVDGLLTNGNEPVSVKLSVASTVYDKVFIPLSGAELHITNQKMEVVLLTETRSGTYTAADTAFRGVPGNTYQLHITLPDGRKYISNECLLRPSIPIDSVPAIPENPELNETEHDFPGVQFYVENHGPNSDTLFYLWRLSQTYKYRSSFDIDFTWEGEYIPYPDPDSLRTCWITENVNQLFFASTEYSDPNAVNRFPLHFVSTAEKTLSISYSLLVRQFNVAEDVFHFFNAIEEQNIEQGDLWSQQPVQIRGNMHRVDDDAEPVLGYFIVAGETRQRIFLDQPDLPIYYTECTPDFDLRWVTSEPPANWPIYIDDIMFLGWAAADQRSCFDCRLSGGAITPPDFWVE